MSRYDHAKPEELELYSYMAQTRRELFRTLEISAGMTDNVVAVMEAMKGLRRAIEFDEFKLKDAMRKVEHDE